MAGKKKWRGFSSLVSWKKARGTVSSRAHKPADVIIPKGKSLLKAAKNLGISMPEMEKLSRTLDPEGMRVLLAQKETAELQSIRAPWIADSVKTMLQGKAAVADMQSQILIEAGATASKIQRSINATEVANKKYINSTEENKLAHKYALENEVTRHDYAVTTTEFRQVIDAYLQKRQHRIGLKEPINRLKIMEEMEEKRYLEQQEQLLMKQGSSANFDNVTYEPIDVKAVRVQTAANTIPTFAAKVYSKVLNYIRD